MMTLFALSAFLIQSFALYFYDDRVWNVCTVSDMLYAICTMCAQTVWAFLSLSLTLSLAHKIWYYCGWMSMCWVLLLLWIYCCIVFVLWQWLFRLFLSVWFILSLYCKALSTHTSLLLGWRTHFHYDFHSQAQ